MAEQKKRSYIPFYRHHKDGAVAVIDFLNYCAQILEWSSTDEYCCASVCLYLVRMCVFYEYVSFENATEQFKVSIIDCSIELFKHIQTKHT